MELKYSREWTDKDAFPRLGFTRTWENPVDYPTVEVDEDKVRRDMQSLHDETKDFINEQLIPRVIADDATEEVREAQEQARTGAETERVQAEQTRVSAELARVSAEDARVAGESSRLDLMTKTAADFTKVARALAVQKVRDIGWLELPNILPHATDLDIKVTSANLIDTGLIPVDGTTFHKEMPIRVEPGYYTFTLYKDDGATSQWLETAYGGASFMDEAGETVTYIHSSVDNDSCVYIEPFEASRITSVSIDLDTSFLCYGVNRENPEFIFLDPNLRFDPGYSTLVGGLTKTRARMAYMPPVSDVTKTQLLAITGDLLCYCMKPSTVAGLSGEAPAAGGYHVTGTSVSSGELWPAGATQEPLTLSGPTENVMRMREGVCYFWVLGAEKLRPRLVWHRNDGQEISRVQPSLDTPLSVPPEAVSFSFVVGFDAGITVDEHLIFVLDCMPAKSVVTPKLYKADSTGHVTGVKAVSPYMMFQPSPGYVELETQYERDPVVMLKLVSDFMGDYDNCLKRSPSPFGGNLPVKLPDPPSASKEG